MIAPMADSDSYSTGILVRRLLMDVALTHWRLYAIGFALMLVGAVATAATAYLLGTMINETVVTHNFRGIVFVSLAAMGIFTAKGFAAYGGAVTLSRIGNRIIAENQRRMFDKLLHENIGFFADRHSSEFIARLTTGTVAVSQVINLLITAIGRDLMSLIGLCIVMVVQDPAMLLGGFAIALASIYAGYRVIYTGAMPGEFGSFLAAFLLAYEPAKRLARLNIDLTNNLVGVRVLYEVIDSPIGEPDDDHLPALTLTEARVEFANVQFAYRADTPVLRGMSFVAQSGQVTALVGPSGGGKSTVLNLLLRFYDVGSGCILIDSQDIAGVSRGSLRHAIAYVGQITHLFRGSSRDNIALGSLGASEAAIG